VIVDLGFGDAGKGQIVNFLTWILSKLYKPINVIRFSGGSQAAHNVVELIHHTFQNIGSGAMHQANTFLSQKTYILPQNLIDEIEILAKNTGVPAAEIMANIYIHDDTRIVTSYHKMLNRVKESLSNHQIGSVGLGIGQAVRDYNENPDSILVYGDFWCYELFCKKMDRIMKRAYTLANQWLEEADASEENKAEAQTHIDRFFADPLTPQEATNWYFQVFKDFPKKNILIDWEFKEALKIGINIFEGSQGILLDRNYGFRPFVTGTSLLSKNVRYMTDDDYETIGVIRIYATRHGPGPFPTEDPDLNLAEDHNIFNPWMRGFRQGWLDLVLLKYSLSVNPVDYLAVTCLDKVKDLAEIKICTHYELPDGQIVKNLSIPKTDQEIEDLTNFVFKAHPVYKTFSNTESALKFIEAELGVEISIVSNGINRKDVTFYRKDVKLC